MSLEKYLMICKELGKSPDPKKMPINFEDLCHENQLSVAIFSKLSSNIVGDIGYVGKSLSGIGVLFDIYNIRDKIFLLDLISLLDSHNIEKSSKDRAQALKKMKKSGG